MAALWLASPDDQEHTMGNILSSVDWAHIDWDFVGLMTALAFVTALLGTFIAFRSRFVGSIIAAILFGIGFVVWNYYPHNFGLKVLNGTRIDGTPAVAPAAPTTTPPSTSAPPPSSPMAPATPPPGH
jgi:hypothetical protein